MKPSMSGLMVAVALVVAAGIGGVAAQGDGAPPAGRPVTAEQQATPVPPPALVDCAAC